MKILIVGAGKYGASMATALLSAGHEITVIDIKSDLIEKLSARLDIKCINADAEDVNVLNSANVQNQDLLIACTDSDERNMYLCSISKELGIKECYARLRSVNKFEHIGIIKNAMKIDSVINPDYACASAIYKRLTEQSSFAEGYQIVNGLSLFEFKADSIEGIINKPLKECSKNFGNLLVGAISRGGRIVIPNGNTVIESTDDIFAIGKSDAVDSLPVLNSSAYDSLRGKTVLIAGGGKTAYFLAKMLAPRGINVKIIEQNRVQAEALAVELDKALIIHGDATDTDLLFEEGFDQTAAFVACTGIDEGNFMLANYAKENGVKHAIAKITRSNYSQIIEEMGDVVTINPVELSTSHILKKLKNDENIVFTKVIQGQAEFLELNVTSDMPICDKSIMELNIPSGILIAGIFRNGELIVPRGSSVIKKNDKLMILHLLSKLVELQQLIKRDNSGKI